MSADIDLDFPDREHVLKLIKHVPASQHQDGQTRRHNSGIYVTDIPCNPITGYANIDYEAAERRGYFKIDFLNMSVYKLVRDVDHYKQMLAQEPNWARLWEDTDWSQQLVHVGNYTNLLKTMKPDSIPRMAAFISIIRPGKAHLQNQPWEDVFKSVWDGDDSHGYTFKKSHSLGYAMLVTLHMNLLNE
jgi:hypothetical protein